MVKEFRTASCGFFFLNSHGIIIIQNFLTAKIQSKHVKFLPLESADKEKCCKNKLLSLTLLELLYMHLNSEQDKCSSFDILTPDMKKLHL